MRICILLVCLGLFSGCASMSTETKTTEAAWQMLHVVDYHQTVKMRETPGFHESESAWAIGMYPTQSAINTWAVSTAAGHFMVSAALAQLNAPLWLQRTWQVVTIADTGHCVVMNYKLIGF